MNKIMVSVYCAVYNHEKYLKQCLDGFVMQKTTFPFEVIVHDDASTDASPEIIREYVRKYPHIFHPIYQKENQYSQHVPIFEKYVLPIIRGKYCAVCEGDDYWYDEHKLQLQYEAMEKHPECHFCVHKVKQVTDKGEDSGGFYPSFAIESGIISRDHFLTYAIKSYPFQTSSYFRRMEDIRNLVMNKPDFYKAAIVGDKPAMLYYGSLGDTYYIDKTLSCYRVCSDGSWSAEYKKNNTLRAKHADASIAMYDLFDKFSEYRYTVLIQKVKKKYEITRNACLLNSRDYARFLLKKENRAAFHEYYNLNGRIYVLLQAYAPWLSDCYYKLKGNRR